MTRNEAPVRAEPGAMPLHDGLRLHDDQHARPSRPQAPESQPEPAIPPAQLGPTILRPRTASCCRSAASSNARSFRERKNALNQERKAKTSWVMEPAYMTGSY